MSNLESKIDSGRKGSSPSSTAELATVHVEAELGDLATQRAGLSTDIWDETANPENVDYRLKKPAGSLGGTPISNLLLEVFTREKSKGKIDNLSVSQLLSFCLDYLKNGQENVGHVTNIDHIDPSQEVEIYLEESTNRWKLRILPRPEGSEIDGYLFPTCVVATPEEDDEQEDSVDAPQESTLAEAPVSTPGAENGPSPDPEPEVTALLLQDTPDEARARRESYSKFIPFFNYREAANKLYGLERTETGLRLKKGFEWIAAIPNYATIDLNDFPEDVPARAAVKAKGFPYKNAGEAYYRALQGIDGYRLDENGDIGMEDGYVWVSKEPNWAIRKKIIWPSEEPTTTVTPTEPETPASATTQEQPTDPTAEPATQAEVVTPAPDPAPTQSEPAPAAPEAMTPEERFQYFKDSMKDYKPSKSVELGGDGLKFQYIPPGKTEADAIQCVLTSDALQIGEATKSIRNEQNFRLWAEVWTIGDKSILNVGQVEIKSLKKNSQGFRISEMLLKNVTFGEAVTGGFTSQEEVLQNLRDQGIICDQTPPIRGSFSLRVTNVSKLGIKDPTITFEALYDLIQNQRGILFAAIVPKTKTGQKTGATAYCQGTYSAKVA